MDGVASSNEEGNQVVEKMALGLALIEFRENFKDHIGEDERKFSELLGTVDEGFFQKAVENAQLEFKNTTSEHVAHEVLRVIGPQKENLEITIKNHETLDRLHNGFSEIQPDLKHTFNYVNGAPWSKFNLKRFIINTTSSFIAGIIAILVVGVITLQDDLDRLTNVLDNICQNTPSNCLDRP